uniref:Uncharacterized protein n=1 Tax=Aegilops tauschii subsp. strangulata TaxID=200361 RepID=A0A453G8G1_AEGTS
MFSLFRLQIATTWTKSSQRPSPTTMTATSVLSPSSFDCRDGSGTGNGDDGGWSMRPMDAEQLRECGHRMVDFIADYYKSIETFSVLSQVQPGYLNELLPDLAPNRPDTLEVWMPFLMVIFLLVHFQVTLEFTFYQ